MTRDKLLSLLQETQAINMDNGYSETYKQLVNGAVEWLESLPKGIALVGLDCEYWQAYGMDFSTTTTIDVDFVPSKVNPPAIGS